MELDAVSTKRVKKKYNIFQVRFSQWTENWVDAKKKNVDLGF
jgi:hypothetical protein